MTGKSKRPESRKVSRRSVERTVYLILIILLALYGVRDSEAAVSLLGAIKDAFSLLINNTP
nr:MAG TPA: hypothetical protein [Caudoviricetes sp.]